MIPHGYRKSLWDLPAKLPLAPPPDSYGVLFGSSLRMFWHAQAGVTTVPPTTTDLKRIVRRWKDVAGGVAVTTPSAGWYWTRTITNAFNSRPVIFPFGSASVQDPAVVSSVLTSNFMMFGLVSVFSFDSGLRRFFELQDAGGLTVAGFYTLNSPSRLGVQANNASVQLDTPASSAVALLVLVVANGQLRFIVNGVDIAAVAQSAFATGAPVTVRFGSVAVYEAMLGVVSPAPTDEQCARFLELARWEWGF